MVGITSFMAIIDFIPVLLFFISTLYLQKDFYLLMKKYVFAMLAAGSYLVLISGIYKAVWKLLYAFKICDYKALNISFFPMQAPGFFLVFVSILIYILNKNKTNSNIVSSLIIVPVYSSNMLFIAVQAIGCGGMQICLMFIAKERKQVLAFLFFFLSFIAMLVMGYLGAKFDNSSTMNWIAQIDNIISQGALLIGVKIMHKVGFIDKQVKLNKAS